MAFSKLDYYSLNIYETITMTIKKTMIKSVKSVILYCFYLTKLVTKY